MTGGKIPSEDWERLDRALEAMGYSVLQIRRAVHLMATRQRMDLDFDKLESLLAANGAELGVGNDGESDQESTSAPGGNRTGGEPRILEQGSDE